MAKSTKRHRYGRLGARPLGGQEQMDKGLDTQTSRGFGEEGIRFLGGAMPDRGRGGITPTKIIFHGGAKIHKIVKGKATGPASRPQKPFQHDVFSSEEEYNQSVDSVVERIMSGQVKARTPDE